MIQRYNGNTKMVKATRYSARDLKSLCILLENLGEGLGSRRGCCWGYISVYENTPKKLPHLPSKVIQLYLMVQGRAQLEY